MAKILYGVMGNTHGHVMRVKSILAKWRGHEVHVVGGGKVVEAFRGVLPVLEVPVLRTVHRNQRVSVSATAGQIVQRVLELPRVTAQIAELIREWKPDLAVCDREFFLPFACRRMGLRCVTVNHSHVLLDCEYPVVREQRWSWFLAMVNDRLLFNQTRENCAVSFYHPRVKDAKRTKLFPPVLRPEVTEVKASEGEHVLVYQTSATFGNLIEVLRKIDRRVVVYGFKNERVTEGNIEFKPYDPKTILEDLASCAYAVVNGGHNLISEALYYGKPVLCFPIANLFEQFLNAFYVRELGYGDYSTSRTPNVELIRNFEKNLDVYRANLRGKNFNGTQELVDYLESLL